MEKCWFKKISNMEGNELQHNEYEFVAEIKQLLDIIIHSIYTHPEIFIRELISNASDALNKMRLLRLTEPKILDPESELQINIFVDSTTSNFIIEDTGIGMTKDEVVQQIGTIAHSGTMEFLQRLKEGGSADNLNLIGKFGVGFYSTFMVTDEVTLETRTYMPESTGVRWKSQGKDKYTIEEIEKPKRGTKIFFKLKEQYKEYATPEKVKATIKKYSNFIDFPIYVNKEKVNTVQAIWYKKKEELTKDEVEEFYKFISSDSKPPLSYFQVSIEGNVNFKALLFIPESLPNYFVPELFEKTLLLYSNKVFIQDNNQEILPDYLKFVKGVVDTEDLPLNISRETIQNSPLILKIKKILTTKILNHLEELAISDNAKYNQFFKSFGSIFKSGITIEQSHRDKIIELLRYKSSKSDPEKLISLSEYVQKMKPEQKEIYYVLAETFDSLDKNPNIEYFRKNNIEVLVLTDPIDALVVPFIIEYKGKPLKSIDMADIRIEKSEFQESERIDAELANQLFDKIKNVLGDKILNVQESNRLVSSPVTLVTSKYGHDARAEKIYKIIDKNFQSSAKILEVNTGHPIIKNLVKMMQNNPENHLIDSIILQLYDEALLLEGELENPKEFIERLNAILIKVSE